LPPLDFLIFSFLYRSEINKQTKIIKIVATSCQILRLICTKFDFCWGSAPDPAGGAHSAPPNLLAEFKGPTSKGRGGVKEGGEERERGREGRDRGESERRGEEAGGEEKEDEGGEKERLPPLEWMSGYAPG